jgi:hypothetical protein
MINVYVKKKKKKEERGMKIGAKNQRIGFDQLFDKGSI